MNIEPIAYFHSPFPSKFGIPRQSNLVPELEGIIEFLPAWRSIDALRGIEEFDYLWLIWEFSANRHAAESPVVRPPRLGGNEKKGVFATRSPYRPNALGLSAVRLERVEWQTPRGPLLHVRGADLMDGTPIYDIKPYITYTDSHSKARSGFVDEGKWKELRVELPEQWAALFSSEENTALRHVLSLDPRPHYQDDPQRIYGMTFGGKDVHFRVEGELLIVTDVQQL